MAVVQSSTARKGYSYETIQSSCEEPLARQGVPGAAHHRLPSESCAVMKCEETLVGVSEILAKSGLFLFSIPNKAMYIFKSRIRQYIFTASKVSVRISIVPLHRIFSRHFSYAHAS